MSSAIVEERIMHAVGAKSPAGIVRERLQQLITEAGCIPVERDALYNVVNIPLPSGERVAVTG